MKTFKQFNESIVIGKTVEVYHPYDMKGNGIQKVKIVDYIKKPGQREMVVYKYRGREFKLAVNVFKKRMVS